MQAATTSGREIFEREGVHFSEMGLVLPDDLPFEIWERMVTLLDRIKKGIDWAIGDALNYGQRKYGEMYTQAVEVTGKSYSTLSTAKWVASVFPPSTRRTLLSFAHHATVASIMQVNQEMALEILDMAIEKDLPEREIRHDAKLARIELGIEEPPLQLDTTLPPDFELPTETGDVVGGRKVREGWSILNGGAEGEREDETVRWPKFEDATEIRYADNNVVNLVETPQQLLLHLKAYLDLIPNHDMPIIKITPHESGDGTLVMTLDIGLR